MDMLGTLSLRPGRYVVAVSGGVDSVVLLHLLQDLQRIHAVSESAVPAQPYRFVVAHYDHGIRPESAADRQFVAGLARKLGLPFVYDCGNLGPAASEATARAARYAFLHRVRRQAGAEGILTAHHHDDVTETAVHNLLRGTGRKGVGGPQSIDGIIRPLTHVSKARLLRYALGRGIDWREDRTNQDIAYRRNYIRHRIVPRLRDGSPAAYRRLQRHIARQRELNKAIDQALHSLLHLQPGANRLRRHDVIMLPHAVALELLAEWLRAGGVRGFTARQLERSLAAIRTGSSDSRHSVSDGAWIRLTRHEAMLELAAAARQGSKM